MRLAWDYGIVFDSESTGSANTNSCPSNSDIAGIGVSKIIQTHGDAAVDAFLTGHSLLSPGRNCHNSRINSCGYPGCQTR